MEIDPAYCDVIVRRYERFTGKQATLAATGETFEQIVEILSGDVEPLAVEAVDTVKEMA